MYRTCSNVSQTCSNVSQTYFFNSQTFLHCVHLHAVNMCIPFWKSSFSLCIHGTLLLMTGPVLFQWEDLASSHLGHEDHQNPYACPHLHGHKTLKHKIKPFIMMLKEIAK